MKSAKISKVLLCAGVVASLLINQATAATITWDGDTDGSWINGTNWATNVAPVAGDDLVFLGPGNTTNTNDFAANTSFLNISTAAAAPAFTLNGAAVTIPAGVRSLITDNGLPFGGGVNNNAANLLTVNLPLTLARGKHVISTTGTGSLALAGAITRSAAPWSTSRPTLARTLTLPAPVWLTTAATAAASSAAGPSSAATVPATLPTATSQATTRRSTAAAT